MNRSFIAFVVVFLAACGGGDDEESTTSTNGPITPTPAVACAGVPTTVCPPSPASAPGS